MNIIQEKKSMKIYKNTKGNERERKRKGWVKYDGRKCREKIEQKDSDKERGEKGEMAVMKLSKNE